MVIVVLSGGIGAQLFQYAAAYALAKKKNCKLILDCCWYSSGPKYATKPFTLPELVNLKNKILIKNIWFSRLLRLCLKFLDLLTFGKVSYERLDIINPLEFKNIPKKNNLFLNGYIQNIKYFEDYLIEIINKFKVEKDKPTILIDKKVKIGIHIRKGDQKDGPVDFCDARYYHKAVEQIIQNKKLNFRNIEVHIFCEEIEWPKKNIIFNNLTTKFIIGNDASAVADLKAMMTCDHLVISNSGYGWWAGAYISTKNNDSLIICPDLWWDRVDVKKINIYPKEWRILETKIEPNKNPKYLNT